jgi:hypothetical protein
MSSLVTAQFEVVFPFMEIQVDDYYIRSKITHASREESHIVEVYKQGDLVVSKLEMHGQVWASGYDAGFTWTPEMDDHLELFFSNYEMRLVGVETVAQRESLIIDLVDKKTDVLRHTYFLDQESGLILSQYLYDQKGSLTTTYEALEVDYDPDFSTLDFDLVEFQTSLPHFPISEADLEAALPWLTPDPLCLPEGFQVVGYSQMDPLPETYEGDRRDATTSSILIWSSDGYESLVLDIAYPKDKQITVDQDTVLEIVEHMPSSIIAEFVDHPLTFSLRGISLDPDEAVKMLLSLSPAQQITNPEVLSLEMFAQGETLLYPFDYNTIAQEALSEDEFFELAPMAFHYASTFPQDLQVVGYARVDYSEDQKSILSIHERHPDLPLEDLLITLSDGERFHHVGLSFAPNYTEYKHRGQSHRYFQSWVSVLFNDWPISFFSHSSFLSYEDQMEVIAELGKGYVINTKQHQ